MTKQIPQHTSYAFYVYTAIQVVHKLLSSYYLSGVLYYIVLTIYKTNARLIISRIRETE